jgi:hypothetical protein
MADAPPELSTVFDGPLFEAVTIIDPDELTAEERAAIPDWWLETVQLAPADSIARALAAWQSVLPDALPAFSAWLQEHGRGVFLGRSESESKPLLAYAAVMPTGNPFCWYGFPPAKELRHPTLDLAGLQSGPRRLYSELHDGFRLASMFHNGFPVSTDWFAIGEDLDAEATEIVGDSPAPNFDELLPLFFDFGSSSVCVELGGRTAEPGGWIVSDGQLQPVDDIWTTIDRWMLSLVQP